MEILKSCPLWNFCSIHNPREAELGKKRVSCAEEPQVGNEICLQLWQLNAAKNAN